MTEFRIRANNLLSKYNVDSKVLDRYDEPHRFYHNWDHIEYMLSLAEKNKMLDDELFIAILFHDIVYDPKSNDNEEKSAELFLTLFKNADIDLESIMQAIFDTKHHITSSVLSKRLCGLDLHNLYNDFDEFYDNCIKVFKEYSFVDYKIYKRERRKILKKFNVDPIWIKAAVDNFRPKIAVYAGSFNPWHKGHMNILIKAEQIFDKVIIARGVNLEKNNEIRPLPDYLKYRQIEYYDGLLTDFIDSLGYEVTLIRGLRNATDLQYEMMQLQYMKDFKPDIKVVNISCDKEFEHISSSSIRLLEKYGKADRYL